MKRVIFVVLLIGAMLVQAGCATKSTSTYDKAMTPTLRSAAQDLDTYTIDARLDAPNLRLICKQTMQLCNNTDTLQEKVYLHLYPNAFRTESSAPFEKEDMKAAYPNGFSPGGIDIAKMTINKKPTTFTLSPDGQLLTAQCNWKKNHKITVELEYTVTLPRCEGRFGKGDSTFNMNNCYPILCAYTDGKWQTDSYTAIGDPFCSETANYDVTITAPSALLIAATGTQVQTVSDGTFRRTQYKASAVRDFAWVASDQFTVSERKVGNVTVRSYSLESVGGDDALAAACKALTSFSKAFGEYPYPQLSVVCADFFIGGMEYPELVMIDRSLYQKGSLVALEYVTAHEVAHQWWYAVVGNNEVTEPWLDEALTEYSTMLYYDLNYSTDAYNKYFNVCILDRYRAYAPSLTSEKIARPITQFKNGREYSALVYAKGAIMFRIVSELTGRDQFLKGLRTYYSNEKFDIATEDDLISALGEASGMKLDNIFESWLDGKVSVE